MVQARIGNNFDIDAITRMVNADANVPATEDKPFVDQQAEALEAEAEEFETELQNPSSNRVDEARRFMESSGAAKLSAGRLSAIQSGITVSETRNEFSFGGRRADDWSEQREKSEERERKRQDDIAKFADDAQEATERRQAEIERQQRAEAWNNSDHTYAGQRMSAAQWLQMIQWFKDPANRTAWEDAMMAETGQTREQVRATGGKIDRLNELIEKESRGEQLSPEEIMERDRLSRDREVQEGMRIARERATLAQGIRPEVSNQADAQIADVASNDASAEIALGTRSDLLSGGNASGAIVQPRTSLTAQVEGHGDFAATAPSLRANFIAANAATGAPLDQPAPQVIANAAPVEARVSVSGMDV